MIRFLSTLKIKIINKTTRYSSSIFLFTITNSPRGVATTIHATKKDTYIMAIYLTFARFVSQ